MMTCNLCGLILPDYKDVVDVEVELDPGTRYHLHSKCARRFILTHQDLILAIHYDSFMRGVVDG
jgi:hypothetical protein